VEVLARLGRLDRDGFAIERSTALSQPGTRRSRALRRAERAFAGRDGQDNRIILVTDGVETCDGDRVAAARRLKRSGVRVTVDVVGFDIENARDRARLRRIAEATGGTYTDARTAGELHDYFDRQRARIAQLLDASICISTSGTDVCVCADTTVTDASIEMNRMAIDAAPTARTSRPMSPPACGRR
jgi:Ca-activated chloride channel family protein